MIEQPLPNPHLAAWRAFLKAHAALVDQIDHDLVTAERLPLSSYDVLIELCEASGQRLRMHELAERVLLSRSGLTRLVDRLESEGYLTRDPCKTDRRGAYAVLTDRGYEALQIAWPIYARGIARYFADWLTPDETVMLEAAFNRMLHGLSQE